MNSLFENVAIGGDSGFLYCEFKKDRYRGDKPKAKKTVTPRVVGDNAQQPAKKSFDNQVTVIYRMGDKYCPNIKVFRNGNIQMTGIRVVEDGERVVHLIASEIRRIHASGVTAIVEDIDALHPHDFKVRMINSNFSIPYLVRRKDLHRLLISSEYNNNCIFQGTTYPGVKLYFYWNTLHGVHQDGICSCTLPCFGKGTGHGDGECKKVTVAIFESGNVLITGANTQQQINDAYGYITAVLVKHVNTLRKVLPPAYRIESSGSAQQIGV
jgi:TATA-box binding protein (TBP) (component of TFIID and TFIIIB)